MNFTDAVTLSGQHVSLVPLSQAHHDDPVEALKDGELWNLWYAYVPGVDGMRAEIDKRRELHRRGQ